MKQTALIIIMFLTLLSAQGQSVYSKAFGNKRNAAIIFIHGGPGGNSVQFEATTAQKLADNDFYVIVYDRRGESRSMDEHAKLTYNEAFDDLNNIYKKYDLKRANLIGFSFGGLVTTLYSAKYPGKVSSVILVSALISQQESYNHILATVKKIYTEKGDLVKLKKLFYIESLNKNSAAYRKECFSLGSENGLFNVPEPDEEAKRIGQAYEKSTLFKGDIRNKKAPEIFYRNEKMKNIDIKPVLKDLKKKNVRIYALYGKQDGIFSAKQINDLKNITGESNFKYLDNCAHYLFVDQQKDFLSSIKSWLK